MRLSRLGVTGVLTIVACSRSLDLPPVPGPPGPGSITGRAVISLPGRSDRVPAASAEVVLLETGATVRSDSTGLFLLEGIVQTSGHLLFRYDADGDGDPDRQKLLTLDALKAGPGRHLVLGDVLLTENAQVRGRALLSDVAASTGHAGTLVVVPLGPFSTTTADDGSYVLRELPEGVMDLAFFRPGYSTQGVAEVQLGPGQDLTLRDVTLQPSSSFPSSVVLSGKVALLPEAPLDSVTVTFSGASGNINVHPDGGGAFRAQVAPGVFSVTISRPGYTSARVTNLVIDSSRELGTFTLVAGPSGAGGGGGSGGGSGGGAGGGAGRGSGGGGGSDAGSSDDGGSEDAGGPRDSGAGDGGVTDAGVTDAGSVDAGPMIPVAQLPVRSAARVGSTARLDGTMSYDPRDGGPLLFHWSEDSDSGVALSPNHSVLASAPTFAAPPTPMTLSFSLSVVDQLGNTSVPAHTVVEIVEAPNAVVAPTSVVLKVGTSATLSAASSTDPQGAPLTFDWSVVAGGVTLSSAHGPTTQVTAPATVGAARVRLVVSNAAVSADPLEIPILIDTVGSTAASVSVGAPQAVSPATPVTITATASSVNTGETFSYTWQQLTGSSVTLNGALTGTVGFNAPSTTGTLTFQVTATGSQGANGLAVATVSVEDRAPPVLVTSDPLDVANASGGWYSLTATFDEPLNPASIDSTTVQVLEGATPVAVDVSWEAATLTVRATPRRPLVPGNAYSFVLGALRDASAAQNSFAGRTISFHARTPRFTFWRRPGPVSNNVVCPGLAVTSSEVWVVNNMYNLSLGNYVLTRFTRPDFTDGGMLDTTGGGGAPSTNRRGFVVNDAPVAYTTTATNSVWERRNGTWTSSSTSGLEVALATDGTKLVGLGEQYGPHWLTFVSPTQAPLNDFVEDYRSSTWVGAAGETGYSLAVSGAQQFLTVPTTTRVLRAYWKTAPANWVTLTATAPLDGPVQQARSVFLGAHPLSCFSWTPSAGKQLECALWLGSSWTTATDLAPGTVENFDAFTRGDTTWLAYAAGGQLKVKHVEFDALPDGGTLWATALPGPGGATTWNNGPACTAANPESFATSDALYVVWEENCGAGGYQVHLRKVE